MIVNVFTDNTPRTKYVFEGLLASYLQCPVKIVEDDNQEIHIKYKAGSVESGMQIVPNSLLFETRLSDKWLEKAKDEFPWKDIFASAFFCVSRYEEYLIGERDEHGRFAAFNSVLPKELIRRPIVDEIFKEIKLSLENRFAFNFKERNPRLVMTYDLDNAFAFLGKGVFRNMGGAIRDSLRGNLPDVKSRLNVRKLGDPYDTYDEIIESTRLVDEVVFFIPVANRSNYDKNLPSTSKDLKELLNRLQNHGKIAWHPGYKTYANREILQQEYQRISRLIGSIVDTSRQHYLRFTLPETYRDLLSIGVRNEYSMGYHDCEGFRAGTSLPFFWYDLKNEAATELLVHPFMYMDGTFHDYQKIDVETAIEKTLSLVKSVKQVNGQVISIWHNQSLKWPGWEKLHDKTIASFSEH